MTLSSEEVKALVERLDRRIKSPAAWMTSDQREFYTKLRDALTVLVRERDEMRAKMMRICGIAANYVTDERTARSDIVNIARTALNGAGE